MSVQTGIVPVLAAPMIDPGRNRISIEAPIGLTIAEIVDLALPDRTVGDEYIRVTLVTPQGSQFVDPKIWHRAKPHAGVHVVIRIVPGKDALKSILQIVVAIAAVAIGAYFAPLLAGTFGIGAAGWQGIIGLGVTVLGNLLINALIPPPKPDDKQSNRYAITGWKNRIDPDGAIPFVAGEVRFAPPFASMPHSEVVGDFLYVRGLFNAGYGRLLLDDFRIGETSLSEYDEVEIEVREGLPTDGPVTLFPYQIVEEPVGAELLYPLPRDDLGEVTDGAPELSPIVRTTGPDAKSATIIWAWPGGLFKTDDEGDIRNHSVEIKVEQRLVQAEEWQEVATLNIRARKREGFYRQHNLNFPSRGRWQVRCTMRTKETEDLKKSQKTSWAALQTIRPEYPINMSGLALVGLRIKSTHQLSGQLDNVNFRARRVCLDWNHTTGSWVTRPTRNPASMFRLALQHPGNACPAADSSIDLEQLQEWHDFCRINGLKYDRVLEDVDGKIGEVLSDIAAAGRAAKRHDGMKWGVVIDRPREMETVDDYSPRNSYGFKATRSYARHPDALTVKFLDATNDFKPTQRIVPWPGHVGEIKLTEALELPGKTDPAEIFKEATRRAFEVIHRPDTYRLSLDGPISTATRGDRVNVSHNVIDSVQVASRVRTSIDHLVELDDAVEMETGKAYGLQFRVFVNDSDAIGTSVVRTVRASAGETCLLIVNGDGPMPAVGSIAHFGILGSESLQLIISGIEAGEDFSNHLRLIDAAPIIDDLMDDLVVPAWSGRIGAEIDENLLQPPAPRFTTISSGVSGTQTADLVDFLIEPGVGSVTTAFFTVQHRLAGATVWKTLKVAAAEGGGTLTYSNGQQIQLRAFATSPGGQPGPNTATITFKVGGSDAAIPEALDVSMITVGALLGGAVLQFATGEDTATTRVQIYRNQTGVLDRSTDAVKKPLVVEPSRSYTQPVGDSTRQNLITNGGFEQAGPWVMGSGWTVASDRASHAAGMPGSISQPRATSAGKFYRVALTVLGATAGDITPQLSGGSLRPGTPRSANGQYSDRIQAVTGNDTFELAASAAFNGSIDDVVIFLETSTCLAQGNHFFWIEPQNDDGMPGPVAGPFTVAIK